MRRGLRVFVVLLALTCAGAAFAAPPAGSAPAPPRSNLLLITIESLRSDHVGCYSAAAKGFTPRIDLLAARGVRFERAYAASPSTAPSTATILTGLLPGHHGLRHDLGAWLKEGTPTLATVLKRAGYRTGAILGSFHLDADRGLAAGFDLYDDAIQNMPKNVVGRSRERRADDVVARGLQFLATPSRRPFFLWVDLYDPHYDYDPPEPFKTRFASDPYTGEVASADFQIGRLLDTLGDRGLLGSTLVVLSASHGEGLGDRDETGHGALLYDNTVRVPLVIVLPDRRKGSARSAGSDRPEGSRSIAPGVGLIDLAPTIFDILRVAPPVGIDGRSLRPLLEGATPAAQRPLYVEAVQPFEAYGWSPLVAVVEGDHKLVVGERTEAFDLAADPAEIHPLQPPPAWLADLERLARKQIPPLETPTTLKAAVRPQIDKLALPWRDSPVCLERESRVDPRDRSALLDPLFRARIAADLGLAGTASTLSSDTILPADPSNVTALELVAALALRNGSGEKLLEMLQILQCQYPYRPTAYHFLAHHLQRTKDFDRAEIAFKLFATLLPRSEEPFYDLAGFYASRGKKDLAFENLAKSVERGARDLEFIRKDPQLAPLREDPRFSRLVGSIPPKPDTGSKPTR